MNSFPPPAHTTTRWPDRLAFDIALVLEGSGETLDDIKARYGITADDLLRFNKDPVFLRTVARHRTDIQENGVTFRMKARAQAEELLMTSWDLIHGVDVSPAVKADLIKSTVKWAGLDNNKSEETGPSVGGVKININFGGGQPLSVTADPLEFEGDVIDHSE